MYLGRELSVVQVDFSATFDRTNDPSLLFKLRDMGVGGVVQDVLVDVFKGRASK